MRLLKVLFTVKTEIDIIHHSKHTVTIRCRNRHNRIIISNNSETVFLSYQCFFVTVPLRVHLH